jgi:dihydrofolate synthase/folylpolyglutamate synthase
MAAEILRECDPPVGLYVSPHLESIVERVSVDGQPVTEEELLGLFNRIVPHLDSLRPGAPGAPTFFDIMTAAAFLHFRDRAVRWAVVEIGLGGRLDSTNVLCPSGGILTNVSLDHTAVLGKTVRSIAREKIGFLKPGMRFSCDLRRAPSVRETVLEACGDHGVECLRIGREIRVDRDESSLRREGRSPRFTVTCGSASYRDLELEVLGTHQVDNAALVIGVLDALGRSGAIRLEPAAVRRGLARFRCAGRIERLADDPAVIVDGAHNPAAARALRRTLDEAFPGRRGILVFAIARDKEWRSVLREIVRPGRDVFATVSTNPRCLDPDRVVETVDRLGGKGHLLRDPIEAMRAAFRAAAPDGFVCVTGSFYLVGEIRARRTEWLDGAARGTGAAAPTAQGGEDGSS